MAASVEVKKEEGGSAGASNGDPERDKVLANSSITNSEDHKLIKARIFVGNLPADLRTEKGEIYDKFRKHGRIMGVSIHSRFAFVQFETEGDAKTAVKEENHTDFRSARLEIKMAIEGRVTNRNRGDERDRRRSRSPLDRDRRRADSRDRDRRRDSPRDRRGNSRENYRPRGGGRSRTPSPPPYIPTPVEDRFCHPRTYGANDVELVVIRKQQGPYAETILRRLYECRITANVLFLAEHAALDGAVNEFGRCGTHYVIIIMPKHEETRALTINMFEGTDKPREYRNLNFEEGIALIQRHFIDHYPALARLRAAEIQGPNFYPPAPVEVTRTLTRVAEMSAVPTSSLDSAIRYLQEMRERTAQFEGLAPQPVVNAIPAGPYGAPMRPMEMEAGIGKPYSGIDDRSRMLANSDSAESIRDSLLGLLKATGLTGAQSAAMAAASGAGGVYPGGAYSTGGAGGDYRGGGAGAYPSYPAYGGPPGGAGQPAQGLSAASLAGLAGADPVALQKALASLGVLGGGGGGGGQNQAPQGQQSQQQQAPQRESQQHVSSSTAYRSSGGSQNQQSDENGAGGGYSDRQQGPVVDRSGGASQYGQQAGQAPVDRSGGGAASQYGQQGHLSSQQYQNGHTAAMGGGAQQPRSVVVGGQGGSLVSGNSGLQQAGQAPTGTMYVTAQHMHQLAAGPPQQIQRSMQQQQPQQSSYSTGSRR